MVVWLGTTFLALSVERFAFINVACILVWIFLTVLVIREYRKKKALESEKPGA